jgi:hypothetical protein
MMSIREGPVANPSRLLKVEILSSIVLMVAFAIIRNAAIAYLIIWLLFLGDNLYIIRDIKWLKEDLQSPDLERRRVAMERADSYKSFALKLMLIPIIIGLVLIVAYIAHEEAIIYGLTEVPAITARQEMPIVYALFASSPFPTYFVFDQLSKIITPEPEEEPEEGA